MLFLEVFGPEEPGRVDNTLIFTIFIALVQDKPISNGV